jgi:hypothetical protein
MEALQLIYILNVFDVGLMECYTIFVKYKMCIYVFRIHVGGGDWK